MATFTHAISTDNYGPAKFIVSANAYEGTHTTIAAALTSASSGDTIAIRPGTYTENLTLKVGVNLVAYGPSFTYASNAATIPNVIISGTCTLTTAGTVGIDGICLQTNSAAALAVTGSAASIVILNKCFLNCTNTTGITFSSSSASSVVQLNYCGGDLGTTGIALFAHSGAGSLRFLHCSFSNSGVSLTANTVSGTGTFFPNFSSWSNGLSLSSSSFTVGDFLDMTTSGNQTAITTANTASVNYQHCTLTSGTSSCVSVGAGSSVALHYCFLNSSNASTITGTGTLSFTSLTANSVLSLDAALTLSNGAMKSFQSLGGVGTSGQVWTSNGVSTPPSFQAASAGKLIKYTTTTSSTPTSTSTTLALTGVTPTTSNTTSLISITYAPNSASNHLLFTFSAPFSNSLANNVSGFFLFAGTTLISAFPFIEGSAAGAANVASFTYSALSGTTSSTVYAVYYAPSIGSLFILENNASTAFYNGSAATNIYFAISEIAP